MNPNKTMIFPVFLAFFCLPAPAGNLCRRAADASPASATTKIPRTAKAINTTGDAVKIVREAQKRHTPSLDESAALMIQLIIQEKHRHYRHQELFYRCAICKTYCNLATQECGTILKPRKHDGLERGIITVEEFATAQETLSTTCASRMHSS